MIDTVSPYVGILTKGDVMRWLSVLGVMLALSGSAVSFELGNQAPAKPADHSVYTPPEVPRQGGNTILQAIEIVLAEGLVVNGTTVGYTNDDDAVCPFPGSTAPDVVYTTTPAVTAAWNFDLCYSSYDTKIYIRDVNLNLIACNDDFHYTVPCYRYSSRLENVTLTAGMEYYIFIDGYGSAAGTYRMEVSGYVPCIITCQPTWWWAQWEGEPPLEDGYVDNWNGGCGSNPSFPFQYIYCPAFCGKSGWYVSSTGSNVRDTDWFEIQIPTSGVLEVVGDAEQETYMYELGPRICGSVGVIQSAMIGSCTENTMTIVGTPGAIIWFWVGPTTFTPPAGFVGHEYNYLLLLNLPPGEIVATEIETWSGVKSLFR